MCGAPSSDGRLYLRLADGSGWTYDRSAKDVTKVVTCQSHEAEAMMHESRPVQEKISKRKADEDQRICEGCGATERGSQIIVRYQIAPLCGGIVCGVPAQSNNLSG